MNSFPWLSLLTFVPFIGAVLLLGLEETQKRTARVILVLVSLLDLGVGGLLWSRFQTGSAELQFVERHSWIPSLGVDYFVGIDGLGLIALLLTVIVFPIALAASTGLEKNSSRYFALLLFLESGLIGTFTALNFFHWFLYWELSVVPAYFLIRLWGGPSRVSAAWEFFIFTMVGSIAMLLGFLAMHYATGTFDFIRLAELSHSGELKSALSVRLAWYGLSENSLSLVIFIAVFLGIAVKIPLVPFHTWLPNTYAEAPTATTVVLTGVMSKMGVYALVRVLLPIFPDQLRELMTPLLWIAVATIVFPAFAAFAQTDIKRLFAYSSVNHLGFCFLGVLAAAQLTPANAISASASTFALNGVVLQLFNHGLTAALLFCFVAFLERRTGGVRAIDQFGGLRKIVPAFYALMGVSVFASLGLPGLNGFISEFLIFKGSLANITWAAVISTLGLLATAIFLLTLLQKIFAGPVNERWSKMPDLTLTERIVVVPGTAVALALGIFPDLLLGLANGTVIQIVEGLK